MACIHCTSSELPHLRQRSATATEVERPTYKQVDSVDSYRATFQKARLRARDDSYVLPTICDTQNESKLSKAATVVQFAWSYQQVSPATAKRAACLDPENAYGKHLRTALSYFAQRLSRVASSDAAWQAAMPRIEALQARLEARGVQTRRSSNEQSLEVDLTFEELAAHVVVTGFEYVERGPSAGTLVPAEGVPLEEAAALGELAGELAQGSHIPVYTALSVLLLAPAYLEGGTLLKMVPPAADKPDGPFRPQGPSPQARLIFGGIYSLSLAWPVYQPSFHVAQPPAEKATLISARTRFSPFLQFPPEADVSAFEENGSFFASAASVFYHDAFHAVLAGIHDIPLLTRPPHLGGLGTAKSLAEVRDIQAKDGQGLFAAGALDSASATDAYERIALGLVSPSHAALLFDLVTYHLGDDAIAQFLGAVEATGTTLQAYLNATPELVDMLATLLLDQSYTLLPKDFVADKDEEELNTEFWRQRQLRSPIQLP